VLAHLRCGHTYTQLAAGFGVGATTAYRYICAAVGLLAALAPTLAEAMKTASTKAFVLLDGTLMPIDRVAADRPFCSGKHKKHGMNVQVITDPPAPTASSTPRPRPACTTDPTRATREPAAPSASLSAAGGRVLRQASVPALTVEGTVNPAAVCAISRLPGRS
jgi:DDE superfamily endonuclease